MGALRYLDDGGRMETRLLDAPNFLIGRANTCQLFFESDMISREHVRIDLETDGRFRIRDLGSRNKTFVNGEMITETLLNSGDIIRVGDRIVEFLDDGAAPGAGDLEFLTPDKAEPPDCEWIKAKSPASLTVAQLEQLSQLGVDQPLTARSEDIANDAISRILLDLQAERGMIALRGDSKTEVRPLAQRGLKKPPGGSLMPVSRAFVMAPFLQQVAGRYPQAPRQLNPKLGYAATAIVAPISFRGDIVGVLYADRPTAKRPFGSADLQFAFAAGAQVGALLGESARKLTRSATREGAAWMATIRRLQSALTLPVNAGESFDAAGKTFPGRLRCGDFGSVMHLDEQRCAIVVVDGGGHGLTGIAQAAALQASIRAALNLSDAAVMDPAPVFNALNQFVAASRGRQVMPCTYVGIDMSAGRLVYINAGAMPPLLMNAPGRLVTLDQTSLVLGVDKDYLYEGTRVEVPEVFRLVCYTDGVVEAGSSGGEALGAQRLHEALLQRGAFATAQDVVTRVANLWTSHLGGTQADDDASVFVVARGWITE
jgi:pSer/pThr/pTyr-binding forkhead associated (FHA) protein